MNPDAWKGLSEPYPSPRTQSEEELRWKALGVWIEPAVALYHLVIADLSTTSFGVGWWSEHLNPPRRIIISDYLHAAIRSVSINLAEAALHTLELDEWRTRERALTVTLRRGKAPHITHPVSVSVADDLAVAMIDLHAAGYFRAVASALDCLACVTAIVCALPVRVDKAQHPSLQDYVRTAEKAWGAGSDLRRDALLRILAIPSTVYDGDWIAWMLFMRHQYVHKPRRLLYGMARPGPAIFTNPHEQVVSAVYQHMLPSQPHLTEVQNWVNPDQRAVLTESLMTTISKSLIATVKYQKAAFEVLRSTWVTRRSDPDRWPQPSDQWPDVSKPDRIDFAGFSPNSVRFDPSQILGNGELHTRMAASSLFDHQRSAWRDWMAGGGAEK